MSLLSREAIVRGLVAQGVPRAVAERHVENLDRLEAESGAPRLTVIEPQMASVTIRIPWSALVSDNEKYTVANGRIVLTEGYRTAKKAIGERAADAMGGFPHYSGPLTLTARVWMPDNRPHDLTNFCKVVHDGIEHVVYHNDSQLHDVRWIRAGVDVDAPRCELTISPLREP